MKFAPREKLDLFDHALERCCLSCGHVFTGRYCNSCGQKVLEPNDKALSRIGAEVINALTFVDSKVLRTFRSVFFRPGELSNTFINGVTTRYLKPVSLFFIANVLYFLFPVFDTFNTALRTQMHFLPHSAIARSVVDAKLSDENQSLGTFTIRYEQHSTNMAKFLLIVFVFIVAVPLALINYSSRRYFYDHVLVALEACSTLILVAILIIPWTLIFLNKLVFHSPSWINYIFNDKVYSILLTAISVVLFFVLERRVYQQKQANAIVKALLMVPGLFIALQVYRMALFFVTTYTL